LRLPDVILQANLPSRDFEVTEAVYKRLGFDVEHRGAGWMILSRGDSWVEFFTHFELDPKTSWFSACLRLDNVDTLYAEWSALGLSDADGAFPRLKPPFSVPDAPRMFVLVDPDGTLWRVMEDS